VCVISTIRRRELGKLLLTNCCVSVCVCVFNIISSDNKETCKWRAICQLYNWYTSSKGFQLNLLCYDYNLDFQTTSWERDNANGRTFQQEK